MRHRWLTAGEHETPEDGLDILEACAYAAGEKHDRDPACVCPFLRFVMGFLNDGYIYDGPDGPANRTRDLMPLIPDLVGTDDMRPVTLARMDATVEWATEQVRKLAILKRGVTATGNVWNLVTPSEVAMMLVWEEPAWQFRHSGLAGIAVGLTSLASERPAAQQTQIAVTLRAVVRGLTKEQSDEVRVEVLRLVKRLCHITDRKRPVLRPVPVGDIPE